MFINGCYNGNGYAFSAYGKSSGICLQRPEHYVNGGGRGQLQLDLFTGFHNSVHPKHYRDPNCKYGIYRDGYERCLFGNSNGYCNRISFAGSHINCFVVHTMRRRKRYFNGKHREQLRLDSQFNSCTKRRANRGYYTNGNYHLHAYTIVR